MKKVIISAICFVIVIALSIPAKAQEVPCSLPLGWACGATKGTIDEGFWVWYPTVGYSWHNVLVDCCVVSIQSNACQPFEVGCTQVLPS